MRAGSSESSDLFGCRLKQEVVEGHKVLVLENEALRIGIDVDHGAHIFQFIDKRTQMNLLYEDPKGLANHDVGGWYELFPNAGKACSFNGIDLSGHGDVRSLRWSFRIGRESREEAVISLEATSKELPLKLEKTITIRKEQPTAWITEKITNLSDKQQPYLWGHHVTFGAPFISSQCRIELPDCRVYKRPEYGNDASRLAPMATGTLSKISGKDGAPVDMTYFPSEPCSEMLFIDGLSEHWYRLYNDEWDVGCLLTWDGSTFPYLWLWQENEAAQHAPFYGRTRGMALEPQASAVPMLAKALEEGQAPCLQAGESRQSFIHLTLLNERRKS
ncbi:DUF4432 family protein [Paenibacillus eucommiae]|uniref:Galactose mutarotase-like enzyme n=1 Tax=Paenibacillus eucommiae TaxID=1355755 RepID=A0ABS4IV01_9BACL|nr:DUF4432 family protein [Paenibacillus eucommiae]MBP1991398.1 galactose mutarotase-like enzyme [Paenibacillus eucommiae]